MLAGSNTRTPATFLEDEDDDEDEDDYDKQSNASPSS